MLMHRKWVMVIQDQGVRFDPLGVVGEGEGAVRGVIRSIMII